MSDDPLQQSAGADRSAQLRAQLRSRRRGLPRAEATKAAESLIETWARTITTVPAHVALSFASDGEIDPAPLAVWLRALGALTWYPVTLGLDESPPMRFRCWDGTSTPVEGRFGIPVPPSSTLPDRDGTELDIVCVPLVAFDAHGERLGRGAGYYDRTFAAHSAGASPLLVGLGYDFQEVDALDAAPWDVPLDLVLTPTRAIRADRSGVSPSGGR